MTNSNLIFARHYAKEEFVDRFASDSPDAADVIIPVIAMIKNQRLLSLDDVDVLKHFVGA